MTKTKKQKKPQTLHYIVHWRRRTPFASGALVEARVPTTVLAVWRTVKYYPIVYTDTDPKELFSYAALVQVQEAAEVNTVMAHIRQLIYLLGDGVVYEFLDTDICAADMQPAPHWQVEWDKRKPERKPAEAPVATEEPAAKSKVKVAVKLSKPPPQQIDNKRQARAYAQLGLDELELAKEMGDMLQNNGASNAENYANILTSLRGMAKLNTALAYIERADDIELTPLAEQCWENIHKRALDISKSMAKLAAVAAESHGQIKGIRTAQDAFNAAMDE